MMATYLERTNGCVHLAELLQAAGKKQMDLLTKWAPFSVLVQCLGAVHFL
jgi:hypothetical protein